VRVLEPYFELGNGSFDTLPSTKTAVEDIFVCLFVFVPEIFLFVLKHFDPTK
jgi:hypothetical protein